MENVFPSRFRDYYDYQMYPERYRLLYEASAALAPATASVKPIRDTRPAHASDAVPIADAGGAASRQTRDGATFANGNSVEIGRIDKPKAIYRSRQAADGQWRDTPQKNLRWR